MIISANVEFNRLPRFKNQSQNSNQSNIKNTIKIAELSKEWLGLREQVHSAIFIIEFS